MKYIISFFIIFILVVVSCSDSNHSGRSRAKKDDKSKSYTQPYKNSEDSRLKQAVLNRQEKIEQLFTEMDGLLREEGIQ